MTKKKDGVISEDIASDASAEMGFNEFMDLFRKFKSRNFDARKRGLARLSESLRTEIDDEVKNLLTRIYSAFLDTHVELLIEDIRTKYQIGIKPNEKDFYRICEGEGITIINSQDSPNAKKLKTASYFISQELPGEYFLNFDERLKGKARLLCQFHLLGNHFLHVAHLPTPEHASDNHDAKQAEAELFALCFVDVKREVQR